MNYEVYDPDVHGEIRYRDWDEIFQAAKDNWIVVRDTSRAAIYNIAARRKLKVTTRRLPSGAFALRVM